MNLRQIQDIAGHRNLSPWVIKLVQDCIEHDRTYENKDLTLAYMTGYEKGKDAGILLEREAIATLIGSGEFGIGNTMSMHDDESVAIAIRARGLTKSNTGE